MAKEAPTKSTPKPMHKKLPPLSSDQRISKRPLLHPPIPSPYTSSLTPKILYISTTTPFHATTKRVSSLLSTIQTRATGPLNFKSPSQILSTLNKSTLSAQNSTPEGQGKGLEEEIVLKATGKAIEKLLRLCLFFQQKEGVKVRIGTGSVGAVDDVLDKKDGGETGESRVRRVSCLEVGVRLG